MKINISNKDEKRYIFVTICRLRFTFEALLCGWHLAVLLTSDGGGGAGKWNHLWNNFNPKPSNCKPEQTIHIKMALYDSQICFAYQDYRLILLTKYKLTRFSYDDWGYGYARANINDKKYSQNTSVQYSRVIFYLLIYMVISRHVRMYYCMCCTSEKRARQQYGREFKKSYRSKYDRYSLNNLQILRHNHNLGFTIETLSFVF